MAEDEIWKTCPKTQLSKESDGTATLKASGKIHCTTQPRLGKTQRTEMVKWYKDRKMTKRDCQTHRCRFLDFYLEGLLLKSFKRYNHVVVLVCTPVWLQDSERPL